MPLALHDVLKLVDFKRQVAALVGLHLGRDYKIECKQNEHQTIDDLHDADVQPARHGFRYGELRLAEMLPSVLR